MFYLRIFKFRSISFLENNNYSRIDGFQSIAAQAQSPDGFERAERGQPQQIVVRVHGAHPVEETIAGETFVVHVPITATRNVQVPFRRAGPDGDIVGYESHVVGRRSRRVATVAAVALQGEKNTCRRRSTLVTATHDHYNCTLPLSSPVDVDRNARVV